MPFEGGSGLICCKMDEEGGGAAAFDPFSIGFAKARWKAGLSLWFKFICKRNASLNYWKSHIATLLNNTTNGCHLLCVCSWPLNTKREEALRCCFSVSFLQISLGMSSSCTKHASWRTTFTSLMQLVNANKSERTMAQQNLNRNKEWGEIKKRVQPRWCDPKYRAALLQPQRMVGSRSRRSGQ